MTNGWTPLTHTGSVDRAFRCVCMCLFVQEKRLELWTPKLANVGLIIIQFMTSPKLHWPWGQNDKKWVRVRVKVRVRDWWAAWTCMSIQLHVFSIIAIYLVDRPYYHVGLRRSTINQSINLRLLTAWQNAGRNTQKYTHTIEIVREIVCLIYVFVKHSCDEIAVRQACGVWWQL